MARSRRRFDPSAVLRTTIEEAVSAEEFEELEDDLRTLGGRIHSWLIGKFGGVRIGDPIAEADDAFQEFVLKVSRRLHRKGGAVKVSWFWFVAKSAFLNQVSRVLKKREKEEPLEPTNEQADWLMAMVCGEADVESVEHWSEERIDRLVRRCIARLPPRMREYLILDLVMRLSRERIAEVMGLEPKSHAANKAKALARLRREILDELRK